MAVLSPGRLRRAQALRSFVGVDPNRNAALDARGAAQIPGYRALCMLVVACLMTGMMESAPLGAMTPMNMMLYFAFGVHKKLKL